MAERGAARAMGDIRGRLPLWLANLFVFAFLFCVVMAYFLWQVQQAKREFLAHVREHAVLMAEVIQLSARGSVLSKQAAEEILEAFLGNTARFVDHLDTVEPFTAQELNAFSQEAGLAGIGIQREDGTYVAGPTGWLHDYDLTCAPVARLRHLPKERLYLFSRAHEGAKGCVMVGITDARIRTIQDQLGLDNVIRTLAGIPRMSYVKLVTPSPIGKKETDAPAVTMKDKDGLRVAEARVPMEGNEIAVALDAGYLDRAIGRLWRDFFFFSAALASLGFVLSLILYKYQTAHLAQVQQFERSIASERENAALGRSAAAIAHEIRNPLNVLGMGLQRLQIEGDEMHDDHRRLIHLMLEAVKRANSSVEGLLKYARPQKPLKTSMRLDVLAENMLHLYARRCQELGIAISRRITFQEPIIGDPGLLGQVAENLLKNAIEAQPEGGSIHVEVSGQDQGVCLRVKNRGFSLKPEEAERILEPYFTTKADGTGLGLTISRRIVEAHGGHMTVRVPQAGTVEISVCLPGDGPEERTVQGRENMEGALNENSDRRR
jgi:two-component system sensor histidine kinase HydH